MFSTYVWVSVIFNICLSILDVCFSSQVVIEITKNKSISVHAYLIYRYISIVVKVSFKIFLISEYFSQYYIEWIIRMGIDIVLFLYTFFLFVIQYHVIRVDIEQVDLSTISSGWHNRAYVDY